MRYRPSKIRVKIMYEKAVRLPNSKNLWDIMRRCVILPNRTVKARRVRQ